MCSAVRRLGIRSVTERFTPELHKKNNALILKSVLGDENRPYRAFLRKVTKTARPTLQTKLEELFDEMNWFYVDRTSRFVPMSTLARSDFV